MRQVIWAESALQDADDIWDYIAEDSPEEATAFLRKIDEVMTLLAENPEMGRKREELAPRLRSLPVGNYVIFYRPLVDQDGIEVARLLSAARDIQKSDFE